MIADRRRRCTLIAMLLFAPALACLMGGCTVVALARGKPGIDLSTICPGVDRDLVELRLGEPIRVWEKRDGIVYAWYLHDGGVAQCTSCAIGVAILDLDLFLPELAAAMQAARHEDLPAFHHHDVIAVSYDSKGFVVGAFPGFGEYSALPADGRPATAVAPCSR